MTFTDIQGAVICPFGSCSAMHVTPWTVMCRRYERRFGVPYPQPPAEGRRFELLAARRGEMRARAFRMAGTDAGLVGEEVPGR